MADESLLEKIFTPFYERVKNPFMGSFIISWLIVNWKIGYATFFLDNKDITKISKVDTKLEYIQTLVNINDFLWWPLLGAGIYITIVQLIAVIFSLILEATTQWQRSNKLWIIKRSPRVTGELYGELLDDLDLERKKSIEFKSQIDEANSKYLQSETKLIEANTSIVNLNKKIVEKDGIIENTKQVIDKLETDRKINNSNSKLFSQKIINTYIDVAEKFNLENYSADYFKEIIKYVDTLSPLSYHDNELNSNNDTFFIGSKDYRNYDGKYAKKINKYAKWINLKNKYKDLFKNSFWISHVDEFSQIESKEGGEYIFIKPFIISNINEIKNINFNIYADDYMTTYVGNTTLNLGIDVEFNFTETDLFSITITHDNIPRAFENGLNFIIFRVNNKKYDVGMGTSNPSGIIYNIIFEFDSLNKN